MSSPGGPDGDVSMAHRVRQLMHTGDQLAWSTAALVVGLGGGGSPAQRQAAGTLLQALGIDLDHANGDLDPVAAAAQAAAPVLQAAALLSGRAEGWALQSDEALLAQGRASAGGVAPMAERGLPLLPGLLPALGRSGARMLDVGVGVAALAVAYAELFPELTVVGLDVLPRVLALAARTVAVSPAADRVVLRQQDVATLEDEALYALAWLPAPFVPAASLQPAVPRVARALADDGWVLLAHGKFSGDPIEDALTRFKTVVYGGTALDDAQAQELLRAAGLQDVRALPTPSGAPAITVGRRAG